MVDAHSFHDESPGLTFTDHTCVRPCEIIRVISSNLQNNPGRGYLKIMKFIHIDLYYFGSE